ncbi:MAG: hypothetical protein Q8R57_11305 [Bacteroidota bacterium]|nr:hypothetical protein [Bacteroidota bacterium]
MKKLERMDSTLFNDLAGSKFNLLSNVFGGVNETTNPGQGSGAMDTILTSSLTEGHTPSQALADYTSWCDDSCIDDGISIEGSDGYTDSTIDELVPLYANYGVVW